MKVALIAPNGKPVTAEGGGNDVLIANRTSIGIWETFTVYRNNDGSYSFESNRDDGGRVYYVAAELGGGAQLSCNRLAIGPWEKFFVIGDFVEGAEISIQTWDQSHFWRATSPDGLLDARPLAPQTFRLRVLEGAVQPGVARRGIVRRQGRAVVDDNGQFSPLGHTFMWGVYGAQHEPDRLHATIDWLSQFKLDYIRQLGETRWKGRSIDPDSPGYQNALAHAIDYSYSKGMRTQLSIIGDRPRDPFNLLDKVLEVLESDGRAEKILYLEMANERHRGTGGNAVKASWEVLQMMCRRVKARLPNLVALSCPTPSSDGKSYSKLEALMRACGADVGPLHLERKTNDAKWRMVRQPYDCKEIDPLSANAEGPGIHSSVNTMESPLHHALYRFTTHQMGGFAHTIHSGQAVAGVADPIHNRPQELWQVEGLVEVLNACRELDSFLLPADIENWAKSNNWWKAPLTPHPMPTDLFWEGNDPEGVNKNYACVRGDDFLIGLLGVKKRCTMKPRRDCSVLAFNPVTKVLEFAEELLQGQAWTIPGRDDSQTGYILLGKYR